MNDLKNYVVLYKDAHEKLVGEQIKALDEDDALSEFYYDGFKRSAINVVQADSIEEALQKHNIEGSVW